MDAKQVREEVLKIEEQLLFLKSQKEKITSQCDCNDWVLTRTVSSDSHYLTCTGCGQTLDKQDSGCFKKDTIIDMGFGKLVIDINTCSIPEFLNMFKPVIPG